MPTFKGTIHLEDPKIRTLDMSTGTTKGIIEFKWRHDWSKHPTSDLYLILLDPNGGLHAEDATLNSPEGMVLETPLLESEPLWCTDMRSTVSKSYARQDRPSTLRRSAVQPLTAPNFFGRRGDSKAYIRFPHGRVVKCDAGREEA